MASSPSTGPGNSHQMTANDWLAQSEVTKAIEGMVNPKPMAFIMASAAPSRSGGAVALASAENCAESAITLTPHRASSASISHGEALPNSG